MTLLFLSLLNKLIGFLLGNLRNVYEFNRAVYIGWFVFDRTLEKVIQVVILQIDRHEVLEYLQKGRSRPEKFFIPVYPNMFWQQLLDFGIPITFELSIANLHVLAIDSEEILVLLTHHLFKTVLDDVVVRVIGKFRDCFIFSYQSRFLFC